LGWAWGAWAGASLALSPHPVWLLVLAAGWWIFRARSPLLFPIWTLCCALRGVFVQAPTVRPDQMGFALIETSLSRSQGGFHHQGVFFPDASGIIPLTLLSKQPLQPGTYAIWASRPCQLLQLQEETRWRAAWKGWWRARLHAHLGEGRASKLYGSMATGDVDSDELRHLLGRFGMSHLLALSGLHIGLVMGLMAQGLARLGLFGRALLIWQFLSLLAYCMAVGPCPSVLRAAGMALIGLIGKALGRTASGVQALGLAVAILLLYDPALSLSLGFQLSCGATLGLLLWTQPLTRALEWICGTDSMNQGLTKRWLRLAAQAGGTNLAVLPLTVPVLLWKFGSINLLGLWVNALYAPLLAWGFSLSLLVPWSSTLGGWLGPPLAGITEVILQALEMPWWWDCWTPPIVLSWPCAVMLGLAIGTIACWIQRGEHRPQGL
jgi:ComEC/Rec2-related protein